MTFPKIPQETIGKAYLFGFVFALLGLAMQDWPVFMIVGVAALVWTFYSDDDEDNHDDPPGTKYVHNREVRS